MKSMVKYNVFYLIFILNFTILSCDKSVSTGGVKPVSVIFVEKTADTSIRERGIDAVPDGDKIRIEWFPNPEPEVNSYQVYRSEKGEKFSLISVTTDTVYEDQVDTTLIKYYYYVLAETDEGVTSEPSDTIDYTLLEKANLVLPQDTVTTPRPEFVWRDENDPFYHAYIIRVVNVDSNKTVWISTIERDNYDTNLEQTSFNADPQLSPEVSYKWRVDIMVEDTSKIGSESNWKSLVYRGEQ